MAAHATKLSTVAIKKHVLPAHGQMEWQYFGSSVSFLVCIKPIELNPSKMLTLDALRSLLCTL